MPEVMEVVDLESLVEEPVMQCALKWHPCGRPATLLVVCRSCTNDVPGCEPCLADVEAYVAERLADPSGWTVFSCSRCSASAFDWHDVFRVVQIGGA